jgi:hypothetical protein
MNTYCLRKIALHELIGAVLVLLLLASSATLYADDKKSKPKDSAPAKSAAPQKAPDKPRSSSTGSGAGTHTSGNPSGNGSGGRHSNDASGNTTRTHKSDNPSGSPSGNPTVTRHSGNPSDNATRSHHSDNPTSPHTINNPTSPSTTNNGVGTRSTDSNRIHKNDDPTGNPTGVGTRSREREGVHTGNREKGNSATMALPTRNLKERERERVIRTRNGGEAVFHANGRIREVHTRNGVTIIHPARGSRTIVVERPNHSRVVVDRFGHGYVQRPFAYRNHEFFTRTYYYQGRPYARYYRGYAYRGVALRGYVPYRYYSPAFYGWAYRPWGSPVHYAWGWGSSPWYRHYNYYFTPYPTYSSASFWLTDFLLASSLQQAYQERLASQGNYFASPDASGSPILSSEIKQEIADEVQRQLALENAEREGGVRGDLDINSSGLPRMLAEVSPGNPRIFVVAGPLDVSDSQGQGCTLTEGDVLRLSASPSADATSASLQVLASKNQGCLKGAVVTVGFDDLQEMQNHMRASIDQGLQDLQTHQGGLPAPPLVAAARPVESAFAPIAPPPDPNAASELQQQAQEAYKAEQEVVNEARQSDSSVGGDADNAFPAATQIALGQTFKEVEAILGKPQRVANLGAKKIYVYPDMKITFIDGKVSDVE